MNKLIQVIVYSDIISLSIEAFSLLTSKNFEEKIYNSAFKTFSWTEQKNKTKETFEMLWRIEKLVCVLTFVATQGWSNISFCGKRIWRKKKWKVDIMKSSQLNLSNDEIECTRYVPDIRQLEACWLQCVQQSFPWHFLLIIVRPSRREKNGQ